MTMQPREESHTTGLLFMEGSNRPPTAVMYPDVSVSEWTKKKLTLMKDGPEALGKVGMVFLQLISFSNAPSGS